MYGDFHFLLDEGKPMFKAIEIASFLGYKDPYKDMLKYVSTKDRFQHLVTDTPVPAEDNWFVTIDGLYSLAIHSECEFDKGFIDWIIRETLFWMGKLESFEKKFGNEGKTTVSQGQTMFSLEQKYQEQDKKIQDLTQELKELKKAVCEIKQQLELLTLFDEETFEKSLILTIKEMVKKYQRLVDCETSEVWNKAFKDLYSKYAISVDSMKEIRKEESGLSKIVRKGHLKELKVVLSEMIRDGGIN